ncbi:MAG: Oxidoreductase [Marmoricola sp.]|nr:Oxidoreductase [Marmoricola sp.]
MSFAGPRGAQEPGYGAVMSDTDANDPSAPEPIRWGVLAPGRIARQFARDLALVPDGRLVATGSRSLERSQAFAEEFGGSAYDSYAGVLADADVDVVYVASPHSRHHEHVTAALEAGKHVLCEKPMTLDGDTTEELFDLARERGLFLMEAMWTATHPMIRTLLRLLAPGADGEPGEHGVPRQVHADLGFVVRAEEGDRLVDPALGAGALLDMGIYPLTFAHLVLGEPERLAAVASLAPEGYDLDLAIAGVYAGGAVAALSATMTGDAPRTASIATSTGRFELPYGFHHPDHVTWTATVDGETTSRRIEADEPVVGRGYGNEVLEVHRCLREGRLTSELVPPAQTISLMRQMDDVRAQIGVSYRG